MKRIEVNTPNSGMRLFEVMSVENRPIMVGDYVLRKDVWMTLDYDGRYEYKKNRIKAIFDRMDNRVKRSYPKFIEVSAIGQTDEKIIDNCIIIRFIDEKLNNYYGIEI